MINFSLRQWEHLYNPHHPDRSCYWTVLNHETNQSTKFNFKHDAMVYQQALPHGTLYFHWYEKEFAKLSVSAEPVESHAELCRQRAQELRDTYKYLRLFFSGGSDSLTALHSFVDNNIYLDEIVVGEYFDGSNYSDPMNSSNREIRLYALPHLKEIAHLIPNTKITVIKATAKDADDLFNNFSDTPEKLPVFDSLEGNMHFALDYSWVWCKVGNQTEHEDWCDISGGSKVKLFKNQDRWYFYFVDSAMGDMINSPRAEDFFISKNIPNLYLKTVYLLKNFFTSQNFNDNTVNEFHSQPNMGRIYNAAMGRTVASGIAAYKTYFATHNAEDWKNNFVSGWHSTAFFKNIVTTSEGEKWIKNYQRSMQDMLLISKDQWNVDALGNPAPPLGRKGHLSKFYCLNDGVAYDSIQAKQNTPIL